MRLKNYDGLHVVERGGWEWTLTPFWSPWNLAGWRVDAQRDRSEIPYLHGETRSLEEHKVAAATEVREVESCNGEKAMRCLVLTWHTWRQGQMMRDAGADVSGGGCQVRGKTHARTSDCIHRRQRRVTLCQVVDW
eukprot:453630-Rhodomonas_salina.3